MNKNKIMHLVTLMSATDDELQQEDIFEAIEIELYSGEKCKVEKKHDSKIVMPKAFDVWHKLRLEDCSCKEDEIGDVKLTRDFNKAESFKDLKDSKTSFFKQRGFKIYKITETEVTDEI